MKLLQSAFTIITLSACVALGDREIISTDSSVLGVFAGTTPCGQMIRPLHKVPEETDCALVQWRLTLYQDPVSLKPTTYKLSSVNRFIVKGTNMYSEPGTTSEAEGKWTIVRGTKTNPSVITYRLESDKPEKSISFLKLGDSLIHLLDNNGRLMIGNESFSYTLSRVVN
ncbi:MAG TPA: hypothetical protein VF487_04880 [Chitinophagaceae bacterium]